MKTDVAQRVHYDTGPNLLPLVDVVMVILLFLMMAGAFAGMEHNLAAALPSGPGASDQAVIKKDNVMLEVRVDARRGADDFLATAGRIQVRDADSLRVQLTRMRAQFVAGGTPAQRVQVVINPNHFAKYQTVISVYQACLEAGFTEIGFHAAH